MEGIKILDGIIAFHETIHSLKCTKRHGMLIKLDIAKAYDKLSWQYLEAILKARGFRSKMGRMVMALVSSPLVSILFNGSPSRLFSPTRGIRQGDPLSPFLLILVAEGLSKLI